MGEHDGLAVEVKDLEKRFGSFTAVDRINFEVRRGEVFGFLGPNGAGKSTTIKMLCGLLTPTSGSGSVAGLNVSTQSEQIKKNIGYMSQKFSLYEDLTVEENIDFYSGIYTIPNEKKRERKEWALAMAGLERHRKTKTVELSGGWKQRLALGCAILHAPPVIFLDEPTSGVDPLSRRKFWDLIYELAGSGVTVFVTTHYMDEAEYCDRLALIYRGKIAAMGAPQTLKSEKMNEDIIEIACKRPQDAIAIVEKVPGAREAALFGRGLHVSVEKGTFRTEVFKAALEQEGISPERIESVAPSLEDVFVSLIEQQDHESESVDIIK